MIMPLSLFPAAQNLPNVNLNWQKTSVRLTPGWSLATKRLHQRLSKTLPGWKNGLPDYSSESGYQIWLNGKLLSGIIVYII